MADAHRDYLKKISKTYMRGDATEPSYYPALKEFLESCAQASGKRPDITVQPKRTEVGIPDFLLRGPKGKITTPTNGPSYRTKDKIERLDTD